MTKRSQNNHQGTSYPAGIKFMVPSLLDILWSFGMISVTVLMALLGINTNDEMSLPIIAMSTFVA